MRHFLLLAFAGMLGTLAPMAGAEVLRCADAAGNLSYTDGACPAGTRAMGRVAIQDPVSVSPQEAEQRRQAQAQAAPAGPAVIDSRGSSIDNDPRTGSSRWSDRGGYDDPGLIDPGYGWPAASAPARPPRDMRPRIRSCDASGCKDRQGNHWDNSGQLDRFRSIDGRTCRPVGTTTICR
ncbi:DUF4124 domain-containing protein [Variovorax sp. J22P168]|uniref:DUF4124 domain-containing protein n=1 Tax=Variovorax jilinensis TaxID=3053513 RepID=UPI0025767322|nr:DUF4124 domain-containing protein [Variovorax sp. J22P168]MDM0015662.1 DUF4124 domain-containing protein [Variovorax sp. J22P168]